MTVVGVIMVLRYSLIVKNLTMTKEIVMRWVEQLRKDLIQIKELKSNKSLWKEETCDVCHGSGAAGDGTCPSCNGTGEI